MYSNTINCLLSSIKENKKVSGVLVSKISESEKLIFCTKYNTPSILTALYCEAKNCTVPKCYCNTDLVLHSTKKGFKQYCSVSCSLKSNNKKLNAQKSKARAKQYYSTIEQQLKLAIAEYTNVNNNLSIKEIAIKHSLTYTVLYSSIRKQNLIRNDIQAKKKNSNFLDKFSLLNNKDFFIVQQNNKKSASMLSNEIGVSKNTLLVYARKHNVPFAPLYNTVENELQDYFKQRSIAILTNTRQIIKPFEIDIYLPDFKLGIEYNGSYWHSTENNKDKNYHLTKFNLAQEKQIKLLQIFDFEYLNRKNQVFGYINSLLGNDTKIHARKTSIKIPSKQETKEFLETNHVQGHIGYRYAVGLYNNNVLVSIITLGKPRYTKKYDLEVLRYCSKIGTTVVGGLSKLMRFVQYNFEFTTLISYTNKRLFDGKSFLKAGFSVSHHTPPGYFWVHKNTLHILSRYKTQKHLLNTDLPESVYMQQLGYYKVWDCGQIVYKYINTV